MKRWTFDVVNPRIYGAPPYRAAIVHGGPGAYGSVAPVARELSRYCGVLEPFQTAATLKGQVEELACILMTGGNPPFALVGHSWGAWLCTVVAARHPDLVRTLILVGSGPFETRYAEQIMPARLARLSPAERDLCQSLMRDLHALEPEDKRRVAARLGEILVRTDTFDPLLPEPDPDHLEANPKGFAALFEEANALRRSGDLLRLASRVRCPVVAIHGDYDPHPAAGVREPLSRAFSDFRFVLLANCGHEPWRERHAREEFFRVLESEVL